MIPFNTNSVDTFYFSVQKCFGLPSGLGVWIYNDKCLDVCNKNIKKGKITGSYHSLERLHKMGIKNQTSETPNTLGIYLLSKVVNDMNAKGINKIINEINYKSKLINLTINNHPKICHSIENTEIRSKTVIVADTKSNSEVLINKLKDYNLIIGKGYGNNINQIRIANFPTHSQESVEILCDYISKTDF